MPNTLKCSPELLEKDLSGKIIVVTGGNSGIGLSTVKQVAKQKGKVILCCRKLKEGEALAENIDGDVTAMQLDLASLESVRKFAESFGKQYEKLDILVNNAGIMNIPSKKETKDGFEMQLGVNHLGHFLLTNLLKEFLVKAAPSRVVNVSSAFHKAAAMDGKGHPGHLDLDNLMFGEGRKYDGWDSYGQSKLANVVFTKEAQKRWSDEGITSVCLHPGFVKSKLMKNMIPGFVEIIMAPMFWYSGRLSEWNGVQTHLHCILSDEIKGGEYYSQNDSPKGVVGGWPCDRANMNEEAFDEELASKFWEKSKELVGL